MDEFFGTGFSNIEAMHGIPDFYGAECYFGHMGQDGRNCGNMKSVFLQYDYLIIIFH